MRTLILGLAVAGPLLVAGSAHADVTPGMTIDQSTAAQAKDLLPPEIYRHYEKGEYVNPVVTFPDSRFQWDDGHAEATTWNRDHLVLDANKQPVDKDTGKRPEYVTGTPFPDIGDGDPDSGIKVLWNTIYTVYNGGNSRNVTSVNWVNPDGLERVSTQDVTFLYYDG